MRKHVLALTYEPKIPDVRSGKCAQTIRPKSLSKPKNEGDLIMFHGWNGRPYRSKWSWKTPYMLIINIFDICFVHNLLTDVYYLEHTIGVRISRQGANYIAQLDGFDNFYDMRMQFEKMYGNKIYDMVFTVIRWDPDIVYKNKKSLS